MALSQFNGLDQRLLPDGTLNALMRYDKLAHEAYGSLAEMATAANEARVALARNPAAKADLGRRLAQAEQTVGSMTTWIEKRQNEIREALTRVPERS